jgi:hypothetical protein
MEVAMKNEPLPDLLAAVFLLAAIVILAILVLVRAI